MIRDVVEAVAELAVAALPRRCALCDTTCSTTVCPRCRELLNRERFGDLSRELPR